MWEFSPFSEYFRVLHDCIGYNVCKWYGQVSFIRCFDCEHEDTEHIETQLFGVGMHTEVVGQEEGEEEAEKRLFGGGRVVT